MTVHYYSTICVNFTVTPTKFTKVLRMPDTVSPYIYTQHYAKRRLTRFYLITGSYVLSRLKNLYCKNSTKLFAVQRLG